MTDEISEAERLKNFKPDIEFKCPFCDGIVSASKESMAVLHTIPTCERYVKETPDVFLQSCREQLEKDQA